MARNSEKAMTALARWRQLKIDSETSGSGNYSGVRKRPFLAEECSDVRSCKRWRREIIQEISQKMAQIQNAGLGEFRLRDLNDEINKLIREKRHWEERIKKLGGPDYVANNKMTDTEGKELQWNRGYKYFGAAKDLPGVKELFEPDPPKPIRKTRAEYMRYVDAHYFGYMDEEDGQVLPHEAEAERKARAEAIENFQMDKELALMKNDDWDQDIYATEPRNTDLDPVEGNFSGLAVGEASKAAKKSETTEKKSESEKIEEVSSATGEKTFRAAHVPVPTQEEIQAAMLRKKKIELLQQYANETLSSQSIEARILLG